MIIRPDGVSLDLPLSWVRSKTNSMQKKSFPFKANKINWISLANIPESNCFEDIIINLKASFPKGILIRGCTPAIAKELEKRKFEVLPIGQEAIIDLRKPVFTKKSLKELANRGKKQNTIKKIEPNSENKKRLDNLKRCSRHGNKPQLQHLFIDVFNKNTECFISENKNELTAAITFSRINKHKVHTELLLRSDSAPAGTMEALIEHLYYYLREQGYAFLSLGEVPFILSTQKNLPQKSRYMSRLGQAMQFAYNSQSLFAFKNKFLPAWQPVYLCGYPKISWLSLFEMGIRTNYLKLIIFQLLSGKNGKSIKKIFTRRRID